MGVDTTDRMSLDDITRHLSRQEAAKMFSVVLHGIAIGVINASQRTPYAPIVIEFEH